MSLAFDSPNAFSYPPLSLCSHRHVLAMPHFATGQPRQLCVVGVGGGFRNIAQLWTTLRVSGAILLPKCTETRETKGTETQH